MRGRGVPMGGVLTVVGGKLTSCIRNKCIHGSTAKSAIGFAEAAYLNARIGEAFFFSELHFEAQVAVGEGLRAENGLRTRGRWAHARRKRC